MKKQKVLGNNFMKDLCSMKMFFYTKYNRPVKEILLSAIKPLKSFKSKDGQIIANKFILKLASELKFQYLKSNVSDETKVEWTRNEQDVKGEWILNIYFLCVN